MNHVHRQKGDYGPCVIACFGPYTVLISHIGNSTFRALAAPAARSRNVRASEY